MGVDRAAKASKIEVLQQRRLVPELQLQVAASAALLVSQVGRFLVRVPISVVNKELRRGAVKLIGFEGFEDGNGL